MINPLVTDPHTGRVFREGDKLVSEEGRHYIFKGKVSYGDEVRKISCADPHTGYEFRFSPEDFGSRMRVADRTVDEGIVLENITTTPDFEQVLVLAHQIQRLGCKGYVHREFTKTPLSAWHGGNIRFGIPRSAAPFWQSEDAYELRMALDMFLADLEAYDRAGRRMYWTCTPRMDATGWFSTCSWNPDI